MYDVWCMFDLGVNGWLVCIEWFVYFCGDVILCGCCDGVPWCWSECVLERQFGFPWFIVGTVGCEMYADWRYIVVIVIRWEDVVGEIIPEGVPRQVDAWCMSLLFLIFDACVILVVACSRRGGGVIVCILGGIRVVITAVGLHGSCDEADLGTCFRVLQGVD